jgi:hypothetical protein
MAVPKVEALVADAEYQATEAAAALAKDLAGPIVNAERAAALVRLGTPLAQVLDQAQHVMNTSSGIGARALAAGAASLNQLEKGEKVLGTVWDPLEKTRISPWLERELKGAEQLQGEFESRIKAAMQGAVKAEDAWRSAQMEAEELLAKTHAAWRLLTEDRDVLSAAAAGAIKRSYLLLSNLGDIRAALKTDEAALEELMPVIGKVARVSRVVKALGPIGLILGGVSDFGQFNAKYHDSSAAVFYSVLGAGISAIGIYGGAAIATGAGLAGAAAVAPEVAIAAAAVAVAIDVQTGFIYTYQHRQQLWKDPGGFAVQAEKDYWNTYVAPHPVAAVILGPFGIVAAHETVKDFGLSSQLRGWI